MPDNLMKIWFAALLTIGSLSAAAAEMPASGTKNFIPGGEAPSYFSNESGAVSTAAIEESAADDGIDQISHSLRSDTSLRRSVDMSSRRRTKFSAYHPERRRIAANPRGHTRSAHLAGGGRTKTASVGKPARPIRTASRTEGPRETKAAKTGTAKATRASTSTRHAAAKSISKRG